MQGSGNILSNKNGGVNMLLFMRIHLVILSTTFLISSCGESANGICSQPYPPTDSSPYVLPYNVNEAYRVSQGNCTLNTHKAQFSLEFAYDFLMDIGTPVAAARGGTVTNVREDALDGSTGIDNMNYVVVDHGDGTKSVYLHISNNGVLVNLNDVVTQGDIIALSGNSGTRGTPHLHFHVQVNADNANGYQTIPISFLNVSSSDIELRQNVTYTALPY